VYSYLRGMLFGVNTGWSTYIKVRLIRDSSRPSYDGRDLTLWRVFEEKSSRRSACASFGKIGMTKGKLGMTKHSHSNPFFKTVSICL
jgi:hypothetical protein